MVGNIWWYSKWSHAIAEMIICDFFVRKSISFQWVDFLLGLCLIQLVIQDGRPMEIKRKLGLTIGVTYVVIGMFLFGVTVTAALMTDIEGKYLA
jgi:hypothetical protein